MELRVSPSHRLLFLNWLPTTYLSIMANNGNSSREEADVTYEDLIAMEYKYEEADLEISKFHLNC